MSLKKKAFSYLNDQLDEETAHMLLAEAKTTFPSLLNKYKMQLKTESFSQAKESIHSLKGSMYAIGLLKEGEVAKEIEELLEKKNLTEDLKKLNIKLEGIIKEFTV